MSEGKGLNWVQGFFRLWLVLSLIWAGFLIALERPDRVFRAMIADMERAQEIAGTLGMLEDIGKEHTGQREGDIATPPTKDLETLTMEELAQLALQRRTSLLAAQQAAMATQHAALERRAAQKRQQLQASAMLVLFPPIVIFLIGASLLWAIRGFRREI